MSSDEEDNFPDAKVAQELVDKFVEVTDTDEALAQFYLQDRKWDVVRSINDYFKDSNKNEAMQESKKESTDDECSVVFDKKSENPSLSTALEPPKFMKVITWNIDSLDNHNLNTRMRSICETIKKEEPDVVHFQEVIDETLLLIQEKLPSYKAMAAKIADYYVVTLIRVSTVNLIDEKVITFPDSIMGRNILCATVKINNSKILFMNTHLESTKDGQIERKEQLKKAFDFMKQIESDKTVIFAGDLNLRDNELQDIGGLPKGTEDMWITNGSRQECRFTWDTARNTNVSLPGKFRPRLRFDRFYVKASDPPTLKPLNFGLIGIQKVQRTQTYPSDHWGISCFFQLC